MNLKKEKSITFISFDYLTSESITLLIREEITLDPFLRKLCGRWSVKCSTVILHKEKECKMLIFFLKNNA